MQEAHERQQAAAAAAAAARQRERELGLPSRPASKAASVRGTATGSKSVSATPMLRPAPPTAGSNKGSAGSRLSRALGPASKLGTGATGDASGAATPLTLESPVGQRDSFEQLASAARSQPGTRMSSGQLARLDEVAGAAGAADEQQGPHSMPLLMLAAGTPTLARCGLS